MITSNNEGGPCSRPLFYFYIFSFGDISFDLEGDKPAFVKGVFSDKASLTRPELQQAFELDVIRLNRAVAALNENSLLTIRQFFGHTFYFINVARNYKIRCYITENNE
jgi:hypothetical protein